MTTAHTDDITPATLRSTAGSFASGITLVTGIDADGPVGFTCQSFSSVSLDPPLVSISVMRSSTTYPRIRRTGRFAITVLGEHQRSLSHQFAQKDTDKWANVRWSATAAGNPVVDDSLAWIDCELWAEHLAGDHVIVLGRVLETARTDDEARRPLLYYRGRHRTLTED